MPVKKSRSFTNQSEPWKSTELNVDPQSKMEDLGAQSLMTAMGKFVQAVENMDDAVMIPSKLRDMNSSDGLPTDTTPSPAPQRKTSTTNGGLMSKNGGRTSPPTIVTPPKSQALIPTPADSNPTDLYDFYTMLNAVKQELQAGPLDEDEEKAEEEADNEDQRAKKAAKLFRHHLQGLFGVLHQLTDTADAVTSRYQETVGDTNRNYSSMNFTDYY